MIGPSIDEGETVTDNKAPPDAAPSRNVDVPLLRDIAVGESPKQECGEATHKSGARLGGIALTKDNHVYEQARVDSDDEADGDDRYERRVLGTLVSLFCASVVVVAQASQDCVRSEVSCMSWNAFAVALGFVSSLLSLGIILAICCWESEINPSLIKKLLPYCSVYLLLWWTFGVATCTFDGPFENTGNGFLASWLALFLSIYFCQITISRVGAVLARSRNIGNPQHLVMGMIMVMSFTEAYSSVLLMDSKLDHHHDKITIQEWLGLGCGLISGVSILIVLFLEPKLSVLNGQPGILAYFLIPVWICGVTVLTFHEPYSATGNGYFCVWGAFVGSCYLFYLAQTERTENIVRRLTLR